MPSGLSQREEQLLGLLNTKPRSEDELAGKLKVDKSTLFKIAGSLAKKGFRVKVDRESRKILLERHESQHPSAVHIENIVGRFRIAFLSEPRIGHAQEQLTLVHTAMDVLDRYVKPDFKVLLGLTAGRETRSHMGEIQIGSMSGQSGRAEKLFPKTRNGVKTYIVGGKRDLSWLQHKGYDIVSAVCHGRKDLVYAGMLTHDFFVGKAHIRAMAIGDDIVQRSGGSYQPQRRADEAGRPNPDVLVFGGWHREVYLPDYKGMHVFSIGSLHAQTKKQKDKGIEVVNSILVLDITLDPETQKLADLRATWIPLEHLLHPGDHWAGTEILTGKRINGLPRNILKFLIERKAARQGELHRHFQINEATLKGAIDQVRKFLADEAEYEIAAGEDAQDEFPRKDPAHRIYRLLLKRGKLTRREIKRRLKINDQSFGRMIKRIQRAENDFSLTLRPFLELQYLSDTKEYRVALPARDNYAPIPGAAEEIFSDKMLKWQGDSDDHLNEREEQPHIVSEAHRIGDEEGVQFRTHKGDIGSPGAVGYRGHNLDAIRQGIDKTLDYVAETYPRSEGKETHIVGGHHDEKWTWGTTGHSFIHDLARRRRDFKPLSAPGEFHGFLVLKDFNTVLKLLHPDGGAGIALTYQIERKHIPNFLEEAKDSGWEDMCLVLELGHFHNAVYDRIGGVLGFLDPCKKGSDTFHQGRGLRPHVGTWIKTLWYTASGSRLARVEMRYVNLQHLVTKNNIVER